MRLLKYGLCVTVLLWLFVPSQSKPGQTAPTVGSDFDARCHAPGVVRCFSFDSAKEVSPHVEAAWDGMLRAEVVSDVKASGSGSLRFTIPPYSPADTSGLFWLDFSDDLKTQFGTGEEFYVQWRQRFSPEMLKTEYKGGNGWKQLIVGEGSRSWHVAHSCTEIHLVVEDTYQVGAPRMYHSCGKKDNRYEPLEIQAPNGYLVQNALGCIHSEVHSPPCAMYKANQWMTFQLHVKVGTWYQNDKKYHHDSTIQLWVGEEGKKSVLAIDLNPQKGTGYDLVNTNPNAKYGKVWLLPYDTGKDIGQNHPTAYTWYDDLIISRQRIADPL